MKLTMVSNYINHHQTPVARRLYEKLGDDFTFIQTEPMEAERVAMGWGRELGSLPYLRLYYEQPEECAALIMESDIVIFGGVEDESYIKPRLNAGKIVIRYSERLYREGQWKAISPRGLRKKYEDHTKYRNAPVYLLCSGAYVASDFQIVRAYMDKRYRWGYFPEVKHYDLDTLFFRKLHVDEQGNPCVRILWAGRFLTWKQPQYAINIARYLKKEKISYHLDIVGGGELEDQLRAKVRKYGLEDEVTFQGYRQPAQVRRYMEESDIFLFTSNYFEGWGAVLNESMNSACAVVAGHGIGAVPFLVRDGYNGLVYRNGNYEEFRDDVVRLARDASLRRELGTHAYETITQEWNPEVAAGRLCHFCEGLLAGTAEPYGKGPLSIAPAIAPRDGYQYCRQENEDQHEAK